MPVSCLIFHISKADKRFKKDIIIIRILCRFKHYFMNPANQMLCTDESLHIFPKMGKCFKTHQRINKLEACSALPSGGNHETLSFLRPCG